MTSLQDLLRGSGPTWAVLSPGVAALGLFIAHAMAANDIDLCERLLGDVSAFLAKQRGLLPDDFWGNDGDAGGPGA